MIVTVTPNPSIDRTLRVPALRRGEVVRATATSSEAGGKGINVARSLTTMGVRAAAIAPASAASRAVLDALIGGSVTLRTVPIEGDIRVNLSVVEPDGTVTKINEPGPTVEPDAAARLIDNVVAAALEVIALAGLTEPIDGSAPAAIGDGTHWLVGCGSLSPGLPETFYAELAGRMPDEVRIAIDADRGALRTAIGPRIGLVKPNRVELEELVGRALETLGEVVDGADELRAAGVERVLVSLGPDGAVLVDGAGACHAEGRVDDIANPVGAGDALLAGFLAGGATAAALPGAIAWSVAACRAPGTRMPVVTQRDVAAVTVQPTIDRSRTLAR